MFAPIIRIPGRFADLWPDRARVVTLMDEDGNTEVVLAVRQQRPKRVTPGVRRKRIGVSRPRSFRGPKSLSALDLGPSSSARAAERFAPAFSAVHVPKPQFRVGWRSQLRCPRWLLAPPATGQSGR